MSPTGSFHEKPDRAEPKKGRLGMTFGLLAALGITTAGGYEVIHSQQTESAGIETSEIAPDYAHMSQKELGYHAILDEAKGNIEIAGRMARDQVQNAYGPAAREEARREVCSSWLPDTLTPLWGQFHMRMINLGYSDTSPEMQQLQNLFAGSACPV